jgi:hypothetical protein
VLLFIREIWLLEQLLEDRVLVLLAELKYLLLLTTLKNKNMTFLHPFKSCI